MKLKTIKIISLFVIFLLCFPLHFLYDLLPNCFISIFAPVNESIWEHMKLISTSYIFWGFFEYLIIKKNKIKINNYLFQLFIIPVISIILYLLIFIPLYNIIGENMIISISLLFIIILLEEMMSFYLLNYKEIKYQNIIGLIGIIIIFISFGYLTYKPPLTTLFYDTTKNKYGLNIYVR